MEQQHAGETKSKLSPSAARHLRRKKLNAAKRESEKKNSASSLSVSSTAQCANCSEKQDFVQNQTRTESKEKRDPQSKSKLKKLDAINVNAEAKCVPCVSDSLKIQNDKNDCLTSETQTNEETCQNKLASSDTLINPSVAAVAAVTNTARNSADVSASSSKMDAQGKSKEQIKAEREAKKLAKALAKSKGKSKDKVETPEQSKSLDQNKAEEKTAVAKQSNVDKQIASSNNEPQIARQVLQQHDVNVDVEAKHDAGKTDKDNKSEKSKKELREERRKMQEAQRAAKAAAAEKKTTKAKVAPEKKSEKSVVAQSSALVEKESSAKKTAAKTQSKENPHEVNLFKHLYINRNNISQLINSSNINIHPAIIRLGVQYAEKVIVGSNARCVALFAAVKQLIDDFERPLQADFTRGLEASLLQAKNYLDFCRPSSVSMENALKHLQRQMSTLPSTIPDKEAKSKLTNAIDIYIQEQIDLADKAISQAIQKKIVNGDVILTYGFSSLIHKILCDAYDAKKQFRVIVVDGRPWLEGKELLRRLVKHGIDCSYMLVNSLSFIMPQVNKVFLGAHAILANGAVMSRVGTAQVALMANAFNVPVLVACETHKSCERVQTDSIVFNEIGDPDQLIKNTFSNSKKSCLSNWKSKKTLNLLNITYDVTPADLVTAVVTELAILPCTSVPVILRIKPSKIEKS